MIRLAVRVYPGSTRDSVMLLSDGSLEVRLRARAVEGQANQALVAILAERLRLRKRDIHIARGERARQKLVDVALPSANELRARLRGDG